MNTVDDYDAKLAAWKAAHGIPAEAQELPDDEQVMMAEDAQSPGKDYCMGCAERFPIREMRVITDPHMQFDDRPERAGRYIPKKYRVRMCLPCFNEKYEEPAPTSP